MAEVVARWALPSASLKLCSVGLAEGRKFVSAATISPKTDGEPLDGVGLHL